MPESPEEIGIIMSGVLSGLSPDVEKCVRPHLEWAAQEIFAKFYLEELTSTELCSLVAILIPIHSRFLTQQGIDPCGSAPRRRLRPV